MAIVAAVIGAAVTIGTTAYAASQKSGGVTGTSSLEFPEETRRLIGDIEFPQLRSALGEQSSLFQGLLGGNQFNPFNQNQFGARPLASAKAGLKRGAQDAGVSDLSGMDELDALSPQLVQAIKQLAMQNAAQRTSVVPAGFGPFLSPSTFTSTSTNASPFDTGFAIAGGAANIAGAYFQSNKAGTS